MTVSKKLNGERSVQVGIGDGPLLLLEGVVVVITVVVVVAASQRGDTSGMRTTMVLLVGK